MLKKRDIIVFDGNVTENGYYLNTQLLQKDNSMDFAHLRICYRSAKPIELAVVSDDKIQRGDFFLADTRDHKSQPINYVFKHCSKVENEWIFDGDEVTGFNPEWCKKVEVCTIISSTPNFSDAFLLKYIERNKKGNPVKQVMVEFEEFHGHNASLATMFALDEHSNGGDYEDSYAKKIAELGCEYRIKTDKDNIATIRPVKDNFTAHELKCAMEAGILEAIMYPEKFVTGVCFDSDKFETYFETLNF